MRPRILPLAPDATEIHNRGSRRPLGRGTHTTGQVVMCGRFSLSADPKALIEQFSLHLEDATPLAPRYNIAPGQPVAGVKARNVKGERELMHFHWGLVPSWAKDASMANRLINARAETVGEKPSFRNAIKRRRCLVPADGFYEWARTPEGKQPFHIRRQDGAPFSLAGLWEHWLGQDGSELFSCTLITTAANSTMAPIHQRMPVILEPEHYARWLDPEEGKTSQLLPLLEPREWKDMRAVPVSTFVNNARNEGPRCIEPLTSSRPASQA